MFCHLEVLLLLKKQLFEWTLRNRNDAFVIRSNFLQFSTGYYGRLLNQIRYNLSPLRFHLFTYNIMDNPMCPGCHDSVESIEHFFFDCVCYNDCRSVLWSNLQTVFQNFGLDFGALSRHEILHLFLYGVDYVNPVSSIKINEHIYYCLVTYLSKSKRFVKKSV